MFHMLLPGMDFTARIRLGRPFLCGAICDSISKKPVYDDLKDSFGRREDRIRLVLKA
jgi:hypothetical protein